MHSLSKILPLLALSGALASAPLASGVQVTFTNSTGLSSDDVYVWFNGDSSSLDATFGNNPSQSVSTVKSYSLTEIGSQGIDISSYSAGQIFVTLGMPFSTDVNQITQPSPSNPGLNSYDTMFQLLMEINVTPARLSIRLTCRTKTTPRFRRISATTTTRKGCLRRSASAITPVFPPAAMPRHCLT